MSAARKEGYKIHHSRRPRFRSTTGWTPLTLVVLTCSPYPHRPYYRLVIKDLISVR